MVLFSKCLNSIVAAVFGFVLCAHGAQAPQHVNINQLSTTVEDVVVPLPNELFGALNKLGAVNWKEYVRSDEEPNFTERPRIALLLGTVIADGFIAVQAEDAPAVKDIGQRVLALAKGIGVGNSITPHAKAIIDAADKRNWANERQELDRTQNSVLQAMSEFNLPIVHQIQDALVEVKPLINIGNARISAESVKKVNQITTGLGNDIIKKD